MPKVTIEVDHVWIATSEGSFKPGDRLLVHNDQIIAILPAPSRKTRRVDEARADNPPDDVDWISYELVMETLEKHQPASTVEVAEALGVRDDLARGRLHRRIYELKNAGHIKVHDTVKNTAFYEIVRPLQPGEKVRRPAA